jgi:hypothetical protein
MDIISRAEAKAQGLTHYFTGKPCGNGNLHVRSTKCKYCLCRDCRDERNGRSRVWRAENPEKQVQSTRSWQLNNWEAQQAVWRRAETNKRDRAAADRDYAALRRRQGAERMNAFHHRNYGTNPAYTAKARFRSGVHAALKCVAAAKACNSKELIGCSWADGAAHLAAQFTEGMSWENYSEWHVDHIRPCASFDQSDLKQQEVCWNWRNLRPLWASENIAKSDKWTPAMEAEWAQNMRELGWEGELFLVFEQELAA